MSEDDVQRKNHLTGAIGRMMSQDPSLKDKMAPRAKIPVSIGRPELEQPKPATKPAPNKSADTSNEPTVKKSRKVAADDKYQVVMIEPEKIRPWEFANRPDSEFGDWDDFISSVSKGVEIPITVRPAKEKGVFEVVCGRRRWKACLELGQPVPCQVRSLTDQQAAYLQQLENDKRHDLSDWANALYWNKLLSKGVFKSQSALAVELSKDRREISEAMTYLRVPPALADAIGSMTLVTKSHAKEIVQVCAKEGGESALISHADKIREGKLSKRQIRDVLSGRPDKSTNIVRVQGREVLTVRKDSNGTPTISLRKEALNVVSQDEVVAELIRLIESKMPPD